MFQLTKRPIGLDDLADVRHLHASAFQICGAAYHSETEINACVERINSTDYLHECINCSLHGLWHDHMLIGTSGWCPSNDNRNTARLRKIYIHNFYVGLGLGRMMVADAEHRARSAGFEEFSIRARSHTATFYKNIGYRISSHGAILTPDGPDIPVTYLRKSGELELTPSRTSFFGTNTEETNLVH